MTQSDLASGRGQGVGRAGPVGPPGLGFSAALDLSGDSQQQVVVGFRTKPLSPIAPTAGQVYVFDGTQFVPQDGVGVVPVLTRTLYVDATTIVPSIFQNGSISSPFSNIQPAFDVIAAAALGSSWHVIVGPGLYDNLVTPTVPGGKNVVIEGSSIGQTIFSTENHNIVAFFVEAADSFSPNTRVTFRNMKIDTGDDGNPSIQVTSPFFYTNQTYLTLDGLRAFGEVSSPSYFTNLFCKRSSVTGITVLGPVVFSDGNIGGLSCTSFRIMESSLSGNVSAVDRSLIMDCQIGSSAILNMNSTVLTIDGVSYRSFVNIGASLTSGRIFLSDRQCEIIAFTTNDATPTDVQISFVPGSPIFTDRSMILDVTATAVGLSTGDAAGFRRIASFKRDPATAQIGSTADLMSVKDDAAWDFSLAITGDFVVATLTGDAAEDVVWKIVVRRAVALYTAF